MREEGVREADGPGDIETIPLTGQPTSAILQSSRAHPPVHLLVPPNSDSDLESERMLDREQVLARCSPCPPRAHRGGGRADGERAVARARPHREDPRARPRGRAADLARHRCRQRVAPGRARSHRFPRRWPSHPRPSRSRAGSASRAPAPRHERWRADRADRRAGGGAHPRGRAGADGAVRGLSRACGERTS